MHPQYQRHDNHKVVPECIRFKVKKLLLLHMNVIQKDMKKIKSLCGTRHSHAGTFDHTKNDSIPAMALRMALGMLNVEQDDMPEIPVDFGILWKVRDGKHYR